MLVGTKSFTSRVSLTREFRRDAGKVASRVGDGGGGGDGGCGRDDRDARAYSNDNHDASDDDDCDDDDCESSRDVHRD